MISKFEEMREGGREGKEKGERKWQMRKEWKRYWKGDRKSKPKSRITVLDEKSCINLPLIIKNKLKQTKKLG